VVGVVDVGGDGEVLDDLGGEDVLGEGLAEDGGEDVGDVGGFG